jgi:vesicle-fusing ATPase
MADFEMALNEVKPAFGVDDKTLDNCIREGIYDFGEEFQKVHSTCNDFIKQIQNSQTPLLTMLLEGANGCGKTALAAHLALNSGFSFVKMITPENYVGYSASGKI